MYKVFIPEPIKGVRQLPFLATPPEGDRRLFQTIPQEEYVGLFSRAPLFEADFVLFPHEYAVLKRNETYTKQIVAAALKAGKKILVSAYQDSWEKLPDAFSIILRPSLRRSKKDMREICMPAYVEDMGKMYGVPVLTKGERPRVGFVGKASFASTKEQVKYMIKNYLLRRGNDRDGIWFRRKALHYLSQADSVDLFSKQRDSYSAHQATISLPLQDIRREYVENMLASQFILAPKGDGNYSLRFFEALSMGRIPVVIDTDIVFPLESEIRFKDYKDFVVMVPSNDIENIEKYILDFWNAHSESEFAEKGRIARRMFEEYLYMPAYLRHIFRDGLLEKYL